MNKVFGFGSPLVNHLFKNELAPCFTQSIRNKAKKASGTTKNKKHSKGQNYGLKFTDGQYVRKYWVLATQPTLRYHGGLNVGTCSKFTLMSLAEGRVAITCEKPDLNWSHAWNQKFYAGREGVALYKKYVNVIPTEKHNRFKVIDQV